MAVEVVGSRYTCRTNLIIAAACVVFGLWFLYDGWLNEEFIKDHTDKITEEIDPTLQSNRTWIPLGCSVVMIYFVISTVRLKSKKIVTDSEGLVISDGQKIAFSDIRQIDKRFFEQKGYFAVEYEQAGQTKEMKFDDRTWDGLGLLLDEIVKQTGAKSITEVDGQDKENDINAENGDGDQNKD
ncbi:MAG: hypothetical protein GY869_17960 [Planctomycetes bacterium]|nr:hypothetical protein [Planctomycetota bacterium]